MCASKDKWKSAPPHPRRDWEGWIKCGRTWVFDGPYCTAAAVLVRKTPTRIETDEEIEQRYARQDYARGAYNE